MVLASCYLELSGAKLRKITDRTIKAIKNNIGANRFKSIAFTGVSGALVAPIIAVNLKKHLIVVRKTPISSHSSRLVEGQNKGSFVIVDDFMCSGETITYMLSEINKFMISGRCLCIYLYNDKNINFPDIIVPNVYLYISKNILIYEDKKIPIFWVQ